MRRDHRAKGLFAPQVSGRPQEKRSLPEAISRAGIFFRADAPAALRNRADIYLPVYLEIINGVEKAGHSKAAAMVQHFTRQPLRLLGVNIFVKPAGSRHQFTAEPLRLGESSDFSFDARTANGPLPLPTG